MLGAVVGSVATGGAALVTSMGTARLQSRKERRESSLALMSEVRTAVHLSEDVMIHATAAREEGRTPDYAQFHARSLESRRRVEKCCDVVVLAGPQKVKSACDELAEAARSLHAAIRRGDEARIKAAVGKLFRGLDALQEMGSSSG